MSYRDLFDASVSGGRIAAWRAKGGKAVGTVCCHVPNEILWAAGVLPVRLRATGCTDSSDAEAWMSSFSCSYARSVLEYLMNGTYRLDGLVQSDGCMMATRILDNWSHVAKKNGTPQFTYQIDAPRITNETTVEFYKEELQGLADALGEFSGQKVTDERLCAAVSKYNEIRMLIAEVNELRLAEKPVISGAEALALMIRSADMTPDEYIEELNAFLADAENRTPLESRARLMVIGSALDNPEYLKVIEDKGGLIVCDALCYGSRGYNEQLVVDDNDVLGSIAEYYLTRIVCPRSLDNRTELHENIINMAKQYKVDGVVYQKMQYCECWGGENVLLEDELKAENIPLLTVEREEHLANVGQLAIRAEAFVEMIEKED